MSALGETVERVTRLVHNYHRDAPFRAPETVPEFQARLLNSVWSVLLEAQDAPASDEQREPLQEREGEPSDDELYNGHGMEGGIAYGPEGQ